MYVEADFLLALIKEDDWLADRAESIYCEHEDEIWTSVYAILELMVVAYRENWGVERTVTNATALVEVRGKIAPLLAAARYVVNHDLTPFDAVHLVQSGTSPIVSSDNSYDEFSERVALEPSE